MAKGDDYFFSQHLTYAGNILLFKCQGLHDLMHRFIRVTVLSLLQIPFPHYYRYFSPKEIHYLFLG